MTTKPFEEQGKRMREAREALGLEQASIARQVGIEPPTYWRYEAGERSPGRPRMKAIAAILKTTPTYLYDGDAQLNVLSRGEAFARIEDELDLDEPAKVRLRALLAKFKHVITDDYLEAVADLVREPGQSDETVHSTAVAFASDLAARRSSAKKLRKSHSSAPAPSSTRRG